MILVALPYFNAAQYIDRAVSSILAQTERDIVLLVVGDGERPPVTVRNDRLVVHTFDVNHGPPFVQQAMLLASPFAWYAPFGSDDWADPDHLELCRSMDAPAVCAGAVHWHNDPDAPPVRVRVANYEVGLFDTDTLRSIGGYGPHERLGQDNFMLHILARAHGMVATTRPTYHRLRRPGSLTTDPETGLNSPIRAAIRKRNHAHAVTMRRNIGWGNHAGIRAYRDALIPAALRGELEDATAQLQRILS